MPPRPAEVALAGSVAGLVQPSRPSVTCHSLFHDSPATPRRHRPASNFAPRIRVSRASFVPPWRWDAARREQTRRPRVYVLVCPWLSRTCLSVPPGTSATTASHRAVTIHTSPVSRLTTIDDTNTSLKSLSWPGGDGTESCLALGPDPCLPYLDISMTVYLI